MFVWWVVLLLRPREIFLEVSVGMASDMTKSLFVKCLTNNDETESNLHFFASSTIYHMSYFGDQEINSI